MALLTDNTATASTFTTTALPYSISGLESTGHTQLLQKSDGTYWLALWNETGSYHTFTLTLNQAASSISVFDPLNGIPPIQTGTDVAAITDSVVDHPLLGPVHTTTQDGVRV